MILLCNELFFRGFREPDKLAWGGRWTGGGVKVHLAAAGGIGMGEELPNALHGLAHLDDGIAHIEHDGDAAARSDGLFATDLVVKVMA